MALPAFGGPVNTQNVTIMGKEYTLQELPAIQMLAFGKLAASVLKGIADVAAEQGMSLQALNWRTPVMDETGEPKRDPETNEPLTTINMQFIADLVANLTEILEANQDALISFIDHSIVAPGNNAVDMSENLRRMPLGDLIAALVGIFRVNLNVGERLGELMAETAAPATETPQAQPAPVEQPVGPHMTQPVSPPVSAPARTSSPPPQMPPAQPGPTPSATSPG